MTTMQPLPLSDAVPRTIGEQITMLAFRRGMSLRDLARESGVNYFTVRRVVLGYNTPRARTLVKLYRALGYDIHQIKPEPPQYVVVLKGIKRQLEEAEHEHL
jgi:transcriptional regulator with XRE-family HTH domain